MRIARVSGVTAPFPGARLRYSAHPSTLCTSCVHVLSQLPANLKRQSSRHPPDDRVRAMPLRHTLVQIVRAKHAFLEQYAQWANISYACKVAGVPRQNIYDWQEHDADFSRAFKIAESAATERLEREAWRRAVDGSPYKRTSYWHGEPVGTDEKIEYSDQLLQLLLRARRPDVYREKVDVAVSQIVKSVAGIDPASVL